MTLNLNLDDLHKVREPNLDGFIFDSGHFKSYHESDTGRQIEVALTSRMGVALLIGAVLAAPSRPPVAATEWLILAATGEAAFSDEYKKMTGRMIRQIIEHVGGSFVRRGIKINVPSRYGSGTIYRF